MPTIQCVDENGQQFKCTAEISCSDPYNQVSNGTSQGYIINYDDKYSLHNWIESLNMRCASPLQIGSLGAIFFVGCLLGTAILTSYGDLYGRIKMLKICMPLTCVNFALFLYGEQNLYTFQVLFLLLGFLANVRVNVAFIYGQEIMSEKYKIYVGTAFNFVDTFIMIIAALYFKWGSKYAQPFLQYCFYSIVFFTLFVFCLPESPLYLLHKQKYRDAKKVFNLIAKINGNPQILPNESVREVKPKEEDDQEEKLDVSLNESIEHYSFKEFIKIKVYVVNLLVMNLAWGSAAFNYYMINYYFKYMPGDIFMNVAFSGIFEAFVTILICIIATKYGSKWSLFLSFFVSGVCGLMLAFIEEENDSWATTIVIILVRGSISGAVHLNYLATSEFFPVIFNTTVFGVCHILSLITAVGAPLVAEAKDPYPMAFYCTFSFISMIAILFLTKVQNHRETLESNRSSKSNL